MSPLPTVPGPFTDGTVPSMIQLGQLSQAVSFISNAAIRPAWHFFKSTGGAPLTAGAWNPVPGPGVVAYDSDGVYFNYNALIISRGYYSVEACLGLRASTTATAFMGAFMFTAGHSNPNYTAGTIVYFGGRGGSAVNDGTADSWLNIAADCPVVCYVGDVIVPVVYVSSSSQVLANNSNDSYIRGRFNNNFTGYWTGQGT